MIKFINSDRLRKPTIFSLRNTYQNIYIYEKFYRPDEFSSEEIICICKRLNIFIRDRTGVIGRPVKVIEAIYIPFNIYVVKTR